MTGIRTAAWRIVTLFAGISLNLPLSAQDLAPARSLAPGRGADLTMVKCAICHDITHITRAKLSRGEWEDNVRNMVERGAPISASEIPLIIDYLSTYYNRDVAAPAAGAGTSAPATQTRTERLLADNACMGCHAIDAKIVGPSFKQIAARYAQDRSALDKLTTKIRNGEAGVWGPVPMPAHPQLSADELSQLATWVLSQT